ncbi:MAG: Cof-type HAD-IIB family hydrolase [Spirochaetales bacterium]
MVQLIALDLDDTLLTTGLEISTRNQAALAQARRRGVHVVLASGRAPGAMARFAEVLHLFDGPGYLISDNGSTILATHPQEVLISHRLDRDLFHELLTFFREVGLPVQVYTSTHILVTQENAITGHDVGLSGFAGWRLVPNLGAELDFLPPKLVIPGEPDVLLATLPRLRDRFGDRINTFISKPFFLEVLPPKADKGEALKWVCGALGIAADAVLAFGDAANDLGMLRWAGQSYAMANAIPAAKEAARFVTRFDHNADGVADIIESVWKGV